jgi:four helix bundle protein
LVAWQVAFALARQVYLWTEKLPKQEDFGLKSQMRRAAVSIASNLAEGAGRTGKREFAHFVTIARGSLNELETQYLLALEFGYVGADDEIEQTMERLFGLLNGLRNSLTTER